MSPAIRRRCRRYLFALRRTWYSRRYGLKMMSMGTSGTMLPKLGTGRFVSVLYRGPFLDIRDERTGELIRLVPYQPNHGVMVEYWSTPGRMEWRTHCDIGAFKEMGFPSREWQQRKARSA